MNSKLRTILIGLISLVVVLVIYLLYSRLGKAPEIDLDIAAGTLKSVADSNTDEFDSEIGKIGDVGISVLKKPVFRHLNKGQVDREFGFEELLREEKGEWEVQKPYLNIYQSSFKCLITADGGKVQLEETSGSPSPKDAIFTGNVVVHILPEGGSDIQESFIYLQDVVFVSEKSLLSTSGPVRFVSQDAQMLGSGLELIYNEQLQRMELFRIVHLASIHSKSPLKTFFSRNIQDSNDHAQSMVGASTELSRMSLSNPSAIANDVSKLNGTAKTARRAVEPERGEYYKCVLSKNVVIDSPEQLVYAKDRISINNIFWSKASTEEPNEAETAGKDATASSVAVSPDSEPNQPVGVSRDTIITCENGIFIIPMNSAVIQDDFIQPVTTETSSARTLSRDVNDSMNRTIFVTDRIDYDVLTDNSVAVGPLELTLYVESQTEFKSQDALVPMNITAQKEARFLSAANQVVFEGNCVCTMDRAEPNNIRQKYTLSASKLIVNLASQDLNNKSRIKHLAADGGAVKFLSVKTINGEIFSGVNLECHRTDYDTSRELFIATGPGTIRLNNSKASDPNQQQEKFSLRKPCYAFLRDFSTLKYFMKDNLIIADAEPGLMLQIDYFPVIGGSYGRQVKATATHTEVGFVKTADSSELSTLTATGGIMYKEEDGNEFLGSKLFYDREKSILRVEGDETEPCYFNGALVERILYDPKTGKFKAPLAGTGTLQIK